MNDPREFHIDGFISNFVTGFRPTDYIFGDVFPTVPVNKQSNVFATIPKGNWFRADVSNRAPGTLATEISYTVSSDTYFCPNYELRHKIPWETMDNADAPFRPLIMGAQLLATKHSLNLEIRGEATIATGVGSFSSLTGTNVWTDYTNSDPVGNFETAINAIQATTGLEPNTAIIPRRVWQVLRRHPDIVQRVFPGGAGGGTASLEQFGALIGVDRILIARTIKNTANEGAADAFTPVWSSNVYVLRVDPNPGGDQVQTFGVNFLWTGANIGMKSPNNWAIERKRDDDIKADWLRTGYYQDEKIVSPELGFQIRTGV